MQISVTAVGDIMMGDHPSRIGHGVGSSIKIRGSEYIFRSVLPIFKNSDIVFGNLEAVLSNKGLDPKSIASVQLRATPEAINGIKFAGFNVLSIANNHSLDHGRDAFEESANLISDNGISCVGFNHGKFVIKPEIFNKNGVSITFIAFCCIEGRSYKVNPDWDVELISVVKNSALMSDFVIVSLHWGSEYVTRPSPSQIKLARQIIENGAHLILGHHPHIVQGLEVYQGKLICYSLGNFVFDYWQPRFRESYILQCKLSAQKVESYTVVPTMTADDFSVKILLEDEREEFLRKFDLLCDEISQENLSEFKVKSTNYLSVAAECRKIYRNELRTYFIKNIFKYPYNVLFQLATSSFRRKIRHSLKRIKTIMN
jgi:gamma-polyglutamate biosynthesis protein CapA